MGTTILLMFASNKTMNRICALAVIVMMACAFTSAQTTKAQKPKTISKKAAAPAPKEPKVSLVVFEDLQCPQCRHVAPLLKQASKTYDVPLIIHDFPLPMHPWSFQGAVFAHYFDSQSKQLGYDFRDFIYAHQPEITPGNLRSFVDRFAAEQKVSVPFVIDPQGKLTADVNAAREYATQQGIQHTPTVFVVTKKADGDHSVEVKEPTTDLFQTIEAAKRGD